MIAGRSLAVIMKQDLTTFPFLARKETTDVLPGPERDDDYII
jgi:hypothetical protein